MKKVVIFGAATGGKKVAQNLLGKAFNGGGDYEILFFVDNDDKKWGKTMSVCNQLYAIHPPTKLSEVEFDKVIVASICGEDIVKQLEKELKIPYEKIDDLFIRQYFMSFEVFLEHFAMYCKAKNIAGEIAELGVYQGDSAKRLNAYFPDKKLYLFDTFEGYMALDIKEKDSEAKNLGDKHLSNTSVALVQSKMPYPNNVVIKKGWFPQSAQGLEQDKFCLVNLDPDLYEPLKAGLEFFYPRLVKGGVLLICGYFSPHAGIKQACDEFCKQHKLSLIPLGFGNFMALVKA